MQEEMKLYGDGVHDDTAAIQALLDTGRATVQLPPPEVKYLISRTLLMHSGQSLQLDRFTQVELMPQSNCVMLGNADMEAGNENISVTGGIWNMNNMAQHPNPIHYPLHQLPEGYTPTQGYPGYDFYTGVAIRFFHVKNLMIQDLTVKDPVTFAVQMARVEQVTVENLIFDFNHGNPFPGNMDGVHLDGDCRFVSIRNLKGPCYDDMVALNADDGYYGPIEDIEIDGIFTHDCHSAVRMLSAGSWIRRVTISNVYGTFFQYAVAFSVYYPERGRKGLFDQITTLRDLYVSKAVRHSMYRKDGGFVYPLIWMEKDAVVKNALIENLHRRESVTAVETVGIDPQVEIGRLAVRYATQENETGEAIPWLRNQGHIARLDLSCVAVTGDRLLKDEGGIDCLQADDEVKVQL